MGFLLDDSPISYALQLIFLIGTLGLLLLCAFLVFDGLVRGGLATRISLRAVMALLIGAAAVAVVASFPWIVALDPDGMTAPGYVLGFVVTCAACVIVGRLLPVGWAGLIGGLIAVSVVLAVGYSAYMTHSVGWQGQSLDDLGGIDQSPGFALALVVVVGMTISLGPGMLAGVLGALSRKFVASPQATDVGGATRTHPSRQP